ncbi:MAG: DUF760 domain-containing protein [Cyanobacteria bacterium J06641_5]
MNPDKIDMNLDHTNPHDSTTPTAGDRLLQYVQQMAPDTIAQLSQPSSEAAQLMEHHFKGILGTLPAEHFHVNITTNREHFGQLMAAAMLQGYFCHAAEQRQQIERSLSLAIADKSAEE